MMLRGLIAAVSAGYLLYRWDLSRRERELGYAGSVSPAAPKEVTTWEGEGGALPDIGGQIGPTPTRSIP